MEVSLDRQEIMRAIVAYMALKGYETGDDFSFEMKYGKFDRIEFEIKPHIYNFKDIVKFANK